MDCASFMPLSPSQMLWVATGQSHRRLLNHMPASCVDKDGIFPPWVQQGAKFRKIIGAIVAFLFPDGGVPSVHVFMRRVRLGLGNIDTFPFKGRGETAPEIRPGLAEGGSRSRLTSLWHNPVRPLPPA